MNNKIVNIGICTVDAIAKPIEKIPEPKGLTNFDELAVTTGGCAVNCSVDLAKMGIANSLIIKTGGDMLGDYILREVGQYRIDVSKCLREKNNNSPFSFVMVDPTGERRFFHTMGTNATFGADEIDIDFVSKHKFCYIGGIMLLSRMEGKPLAGVLAELGRRGVVTIVDTVFVARDQAGWQEVVYPMLEHIDYFVPSQPEAQAITGKSDAEGIVEVLRSKGAKNLVIKLGEKGVYYAMENGENGYAPAYTVENMADATGAGDAWDAGFIAGLSQDNSVEEACLLGNATAAHCIQSSGASTGMVSLDEIKKFQDKQS